VEARPGLRLQSYHAVEFGRRRLDPRIDIGRPGLCRFELPDCSFQRLTVGNGLGHRRCGVCGHAE
jgi:hypothetical protein